MAVGEKGKQLTELALCTFAACDRTQLAATSCREHVPKVAELWDNFKLFVSNLNLWNFSFIDSLSSPKASGTPELRVRAQGSLNATAFLMHPALAATTEDCNRATNSWLTDTTGVLSRFLQHVQINARDGERGGSMVECRTPEREVGGSKPTAAVLCPWARHFTPRKYWLITQEVVAPSRHDWKIVDWDVKPQHKQTINARLHNLCLPHVHT